MAAVISLFLENYSDLIIILAVVVANGIVGFIQERKASNTLAELRKFIKPMKYDLSCPKDKYV